MDIWIVQFSFHGISYYIPDAQERNFQKTFEKFSELVLTLCNNTMGTSECPSANNLFFLFITHTATFREYTLQVK